MFENFVKLVDPLGDCEIDLALFVKISENTDVVNIYHREVYAFTLILRNRR